MSLYYEILPLQAVFVSRPCRRAKGPQFQRNRISGNHLKVFYRPSSRIRALMGYRRAAKTPRPGRGGEKRAGEQGRHSRGRKWRMRDCRPLRPCRRSGYLYEYDPSYLLQVSPRMIFFLPGVIPRAHPRCLYRPGSTEWAIAGTSKLSPKNALTVPATCRGTAIASLY